MKGERKMKLFDIFDAWHDEASIDDPKNPWGAIDLHGFKNEKEYLAAYAEGFFEIKLNDEQLEKILNAYHAYVNEANTTGEYGRAWYEMKGELHDDCGHSPREEEKKLERDYF